MIASTPFLCCGLAALAKFTDHVRDPLPEVNVFWEFTSFAFGIAVAHLDDEKAVLFEP